MLVHLFVCLLCLALLVLRGAFPYLCWRCLSSLALFSVACFLLGVLFGFAGVGFADVAGRSCTLPLANALSVLLLARWVRGWVGGWVE